MNELKFNSQVCTTIEQSKKLLELGLKPETADMAHQYIEAEWDWIISPCDWNHCTMSEELIPAWSLHRLMEIYSTSDDDCFVITINRTFDDIIDDIEWSINKGYFNKEYLKL